MQIDFRSNKFIFLLKFEESLQWKIERHYETFLSLGIHFPLTAIMYFLLLNRTLACDKSVPFVRVYIYIDKQVNSLKKE